MTEPFHPGNIPLHAQGSLELSRHLLTIKEQMFSVTLADGVFDIPAKWLMVNLFFWRPLIRRNMPVMRRHTLVGGLVTSKNLAAVQTEIYDDVISLHTSNGSVIPPEVDRNILEDLCESMNDLHTMIATQLGEYHLSISAFELCDLLLHPEVEPMTRIDVSAEMQIGIRAAEEKFKAGGMAIMKKLSDRTLPNNVLAPFIELGHLSDKQLPQVLCALGFRTDASDSMVRKPITASYMRGMRNITDYAIESLMAKKTVYYNKNAMPDSQYNNRKQQILSSAVEHLYPGDCGSTLTVPFHVTVNNARNILDKNIVEGGKIVCLSKDNINRYIGTTVKFRSPLTCRHTDGICHVCGGKLTHYMPPNTSIGIASTTEYMANVAQLVLSAKHFSATKAIPYVVAEQMQDLLVVRRNDIFVREGIDIARLKIGVSFQDIQYIKELLPRDGGDDDEPTAITEQQFSSLHTAIFADSETNTLVTPEVQMAAGGIVPYFSAEILNFIREHPKSVMIAEDVVWLSLRGFDHIHEPIFRYVVQSNSMLRFVETLANFATKSIRDFTSLPEALGAFARMVFTEVNVNILHLEIVLKSYLITSDHNYNIPEVTDINNVKFGTLLSIIPRRSLGGLYAYERLDTFMTEEPELYLFGHRRGIFDSFFYSATE